MRDAVSRNFPSGTHVTQPKGGSVIWVEMPEGVNALRLHERALSQGIAVAPGVLFTLGEQYGNCIRLNAAFWGPKVEASIATLGKLVRSG
jgi:DNA-binding transcriptional MocR family regulator